MKNSQPQTITVSSFRDMGRIFHERDMQAAANLRKTSAARKANKARNAAKRAKA